MSVTQVVGVILVLAGIAWMFVAYLVPEPQARARGQGGIWDAIVETIKRMPARYLPGTLMILVGVVLLLAA